MKICLQCKILYREQVMACPDCRAELTEVELAEALRLTEQEAFSKTISGPVQNKRPDGQTQYHIRCYLEDRSLFLDFDLYKNRMKHGQKHKTFFIAPVNMTAVINLPWFLFNVISSNLFHLQYTGFCSRCHAKFIPGRHSHQECDYNVEYFNILDDILSGKIVVRREIYQEYAREKSKKRERSAYHDLFERPVRWEGFWDLVSISSTIFFWLYVALFISYPMAQVLVQKLQHIEAYELTFLTLR